MQAGGISVQARMQATTQAEVLVKRAPKCNPRRADASQSALRCKPKLKSSREPKCKARRGPKGKQVAGQNRSQVAGQNARQDAGQNADQHASQNARQDAGQNSGSETGRDNALLGTLNSRFHGRGRLVWAWACAIHRGRR